MAWSTGRYRRRCGWEGNDEGSEAVNELTDSEKARLNWLAATEGMGWQFTLDYGGLGLVLPRRVGPYAAVRSDRRL